MGKSPSLALIGTGLDVDAAESRRGVGIMPGLVAREAVV